MIPEDWGEVTKEGVWLKGLEEGKGAPKGKLPKNQGTPLTEEGLHLHAEGWLGGKEDLWIQVEGSCDSLLGTLLLL